MLTLGILTVAVVLVPLVPVAYFAGVSRGRRGLSDELLGDRDKGLRALETLAKAHGAKVTAVEL